MNEKQKLFTRHSIGTRIAALFMLLILVITGVMTYVSISVSTSELLDSSTDYTEQLILRVNAELDMYVEYMKDISDFIVDNGAVAAYLQAANEHRLTDAACRGAQQQLAAAQKIRAEITSIALIPQSGGALFGSEGASLNTYSNYHTADWYVDALADPDEVQVSSSRVENLIAGQYNWVVSFSKAVLDAAGQVQGVLLIDLNYQIIDRLCADIQLGSLLVIRGVKLVRVDSGRLVVYMPSYPEGKKYFAAVEIKDLNVLAEIETLLLGAYPKLAQGNRKEKSK